MSEPREVDFDAVYVEESKRRVASNFLDSCVELENIEGEERKEIIEGLAKMITAAEIYIFDGEIGDTKVGVYVFDEVPDDNPRAFLAFAQRQEHGVESVLHLITAEELITKYEFSTEELRRLGFSVEE